jgi:hypothetical protein
LVARCVGTYRVSYIYHCFLNRLIQNGFYGPHIGIPIELPYTSHQIAVDIGYARNFFSALCLVAMFCYWL